MKKVSIDQFEGDFVRCEDLNTEVMCNIEKKRIPQKAREGDILNISDDGKIFIDENETKLRRKKMSQLQGEIFHNNKIN